MIKRNWKLIAGGFAILFVGVGIGSSGAEAKPEVKVVEKTAEPQVITKTETKTVNVEKTPKSCTEALDIAQEGFGEVAEVFSTMGADLNDGRLSNDTTLVIENMSRWMTNHSRNFQALVADCHSKA